MAGARIDPGTVQTPVDVLELRAEHCRVNAKASLNEADYLREQANAHEADAERALALAEQCDVAVKALLQQVPA